MPNSIVKTAIRTECGLVPFSKKVGGFLDEHPTINKIVVLANYVFRTAMMVTFMSALPFSPIANFMLSLGASIFYRVTIERFCQFRFAILSCAAGASYELAKPGLLAIISGAALESIKAYGKALTYIFPLLICATAIGIVTNRNVDDRYRQTHLPQSKAPQTAKATLSTAPPTKKSCCHAN